MPPSVITMLQQLSLGYRPGSKLCSISEFLCGLFLAHFRSTISISPICFLYFGFRKSRTVACTSPVVPCLPNFQFSYLLLPLLPFLLCSAPISLQSLTLEYFILVVFLYLLSLFPRLPSWGHLLPLCASINPLISLFWYLSCICQFV